MIQYDYCFMVYFKILEPVTLMCFNFSLLLLLLLCCVKESFHMHGARGQLLGVSYPSVVDSGRQTEVLSLVE